MLKLPLLSMFCALLALPTFALRPKKEITAIRVSQKPVIDGKLDDALWRGVPIATQFVQMEPDNGKASNFKTEVKIVYTNSSIVVGAMMYDSNPEGIFRSLSKRDQINNSDFFSVLLDPFNTGLDAFEFIVTVAGVQFDAKMLSSGEDTSWDAVWYSATDLNDKGWSAEIEIPYSALRFPKTEVQTWGLNLVRNIQSVREKVSWNFIDKNESGMVSQSGILRGIENVKPPVRLSFSPYLSTYLDKKSDESSWDFKYRGGMDLKYGINESYTMDMMLVPDFGQIQSDDQVLNLSPFEVKFSEKRQFFTEATELFNRGGVFYSRRIGDRPINKGKADDNLSKHEKVIENPVESKIVNATKISGRNTKGLAIGALNAMTKNTFAEIRDTLSGEKRKVKTQPFTNYSMVVVDQSLKNESFVSAYNTNVYIPDLDFIANVSGAQFELRNKERSYNLKGKINVSQRYRKETDDEIGHLHELQFGRIKGKFNWNFFHRVIGNKYNPNDLGFLDRNNRISNQLNLFYNDYEPTKHFISRRGKILFHHEANYEPRRYSSFSMYYNCRFTTHERLSFGFYGNTRPMHRYDYNEPRISGMKLRRGSWTFGGLWFSTDYRKAFALDVDINSGKSLSTDDTKTLRLKIGPRYRFSDKFLMEYQTIWNRRVNELGYADSETIDDRDVVYIGERNRTVLENKLTANYIFNNKLSLSFRMRHYWAKAEYSNFYTLKDNGRLRASDYNENNDVNYNRFNIDMVCSWRFAAGSELAFVWKNSIVERGDQVVHSFSKNLRNTFDATQLNSISIKLLYYIDYASLFKKS